LVFIQSNINKEDDDVDDDDDDDFVVPIRVYGDTHAETGRISRRTSLAINMNAIAPTTTEKSFEMAVEYIRKTKTETEIWGDKPRIVDCGDCPR
jgi:hypothetical protein